MLLEPPSAPSTIWRKPSLKLLRSVLSSDSAPLTMEPSEIVRVGSMVRKLRLPPALRTAALMSTSLAAMSTLSPLASSVDDRLSLLFLSRLTTPVLPARAPLPLPVPSVTPLAATTATVSRLLLVATTLSALM